MEISLITTVLNEQKTIKSLLESILRQTTFPDEVIIVDGGSEDNTLAEIEKFRKRAGQKKNHFKILQKIGNRSLGRNEAIKKARGNIMLCTDAGCVLDRDWVKRIVMPFRDPSVDVVAGFYSGKASSAFQQALVPYVLVMSDRVKPSAFLPASRSMAFRKEIWTRAGGFPERFSHNEDYVFASRLKEFKAKIVFQRNALVYWIPRSGIMSSFIMFFRFALGDIEAKLLRPKVVLLFFRYLVGVVLVMYLIESKISLAILIPLLILYLFWAVIKNFRYVRQNLAYLYLSLIQVLSDIAVITGTVFGVIRFFK